MSLQQQRQSDDSDDHPTDEDERIELFRKGVSGRTYQSIVEIEDVYGENIMTRVDGSVHSREDYSIRYVNSIPEELYDDGGLTRVTFRDERYYEQYGVSHE